MMFLGVGLTLKAQIDFNNPPWNTGCDSLETQMEMNMCSAEKLHIADSILNLYYNQLIVYIDSLYKDELKISTNTTDKIEKEYLLKLKNQKAAIIKSRKDFITFLNSTTDIIDYQYQRGSMRPMAENRYALELTINQIKILIELMNEIIDQ